MTASGLPQGLEKCLSALLQDNSLTSWRIFAGDSGDHTVTIKLHARETVHGEQHTGGWYKKGHARVKRDRQRWTQHQNKTLNDFQKPCGVVAAKSPIADVSREQTRGDGFLDEVLCTSSEVCNEGVLTTETVTMKETDQDLCVTDSKASTNITSNLDESTLSPETTDVSGDACIASNFDSATESTQRQFKSLFPDIFPDPCQSTCTQQSDNTDTQRPPPSPPDPVARESRSDAEEEMEATSGGGTGKGTGEEGDTESDWSTESDIEDPFLKTVEEKITNAKCSPKILSLMTKVERNREFLNIVIDRRSFRPERLVCRSDDVVLTYEIGNGRKDFHIIERRGPIINNHGDDLARCCRMGWPEIDRGGAYKDTIGEMLGDLKKSMVLVRDLVSMQ